MQRDSHTISIWQDALSSGDTGTGPAGYPVYDVIIIGAGITGLTTALLLQESGKRCLILEAGNIGFGTTSGTTAHLNTVLDTPYTDIIKKFGKENARLVAQAAGEAIALIREHTDRYHIQCDFMYRDGYLFAQEEGEEKTLDDIYDALGQVGIEAGYTEVIPVPLPFTRAIRFGGQAQFHPVKYLMGLADAFRDKDGVILEHAVADRVTFSGDDHVVYTGSREYRAQAVVYATHIPSGLNSLHFKCAPYRSYVLGLELEQDEAYPEGLAYDLKDPYHYFRTVYLDGRKILLLGGNDHKTGHEENTGSVFTDLEAYARNHYAVRSVVYKWSAQYYEPADGLPYIGKLPGAGGHMYVATGYSGNGMIFGTLAGRILSSLILDQESPYASLLAPSRIKPVASFRNFVRENFDVAKHFIADRIGIASLPGFADLGKGEGRVVKYNEAQVAIYKDEQGNLKALHPVCPHAGCVVQWNSAEKSWDCPCHGARYDVEGRLLNGPASSGLRSIPLD